MASKQEYQNFCEFIAECIMQDDFEEEAGFYAEIICRKLYKLGIVDKDDENWVLRREE